MYRSFEKKEVVGYRIRRIFKRIVRVIFVNLLLLFLYLFSFEREKLKLFLYALLPDTVRSFAGKVTASYSRNICRKFTVDGIKFSNYSRIQECIKEHCQRDDFSLRDLELALREDPWIRKLYLHRTIAGGLKVIIVEYNPFAIFTNDYKNYSLLDEFGTKIDIPQQDMDSYLFTIVDNNFNAEEINRLFNILSVHSEIAKNISVVIRIGDRRWNLRLKNGVLVKMPEESDTIMESWTILDTLLGIQGVDIGLAEIDLRVEGRVFMKYDGGTKSEIENFSRNLSFTKRFGIDNF
jgi:hypothetical protein